MKISNSFVIKLVVVTILFKIASECGAAEHCIPRNYNVNPDNIVTASGFTPDEALKNFHAQLPQIGILQTVNLKTKKTRKDDFFSQSTDISKGIHANFDYVTKFQCKKGLNYVISGIVPKETIDYFPKEYNSSKNVLKKYFTFKSAKKYCKNESYHIVTTNEFIKPKARLNKLSYTGTKPVFIHTNKKQGWQIAVFCGYNWKIHIKYADPIQPSVKNTWYDFLFSGIDPQPWIGNYTKYIQLQMISNAIKGE